MPTRSWHARSMGCARVGRRSGCAQLAFFAALSLAAPTLRAEDSDRQREQARQFATQGYEALQRKNFVVAEELFRRADALVHAPTLVVDHARALVGLGKLVEAHERYALVLREGVADSAPWQWKRALQDAETELSQLEPRLAWLTIRVRGPRKPVVTIDDKNIPRAALGVRRATNPGTRTIRARAEGFLPKSETVTLKEGGANALEIFLERDPDAPVIEEQEPEAEVLLVLTPSGPKPPDRTLAYILLGAGAVGIVTGSVTGVMALGVRSDLKEACPSGTCFPGDEEQFADFRSQVNRYRGLGTASGVAFAVGVAAAASGALLFLFTGAEEPESDEPSGTPALSAVLGPRSFALHGTF